MRIEDDLRAALAARDPGPDFAAAVLARLDAEAASAGSKPRWPVPAALAASLLVAVTSLALLHQQRVHQQQAQAQQLQLALAITSERLTQVQQKLSRPQYEENGT